MMRTFLGKSVAIAAVAALAACASTTPVETEATTTVYPSQTTQQTGPLPGSAEDLMQSAGGRVFFGYNQYNLTNEAQSTLRRQAAWLEEYPRSRVRLEGNCDERGTRNYNLALGARRANAAKAFLIGLGVDPARITVVSNGKERPVDTRSTPEAWGINRNASTVLLTTIGS